MFTSLAALLLRVTSLMSVAASCMLLHTTLLREFRLQIAYILVYSDCYFFCFLEQ